MSPAPHRCRQSRAAFLAGVVSVFFSFCGITGAPAQDALPKPTGAVILTVTGDITRTNGPGRAEFDRPMLEALGVKTVATTTSWTTGKHEFSGPLGRSVMEAVGAKGGMLSFVAINDYKVQIPAADFQKYPAILALKMDGEYMTIRNKGPLWVIYPRDDYPELVDKAHDAKWIWQIKAVEVR